MSKRLRELRQKKATMVARANALNAKKDAGTELTAEEVAELATLLGSDDKDGVDGELAKITAEILREERLADHARSVGAEEPPALAAGAQGGQRGTRVTVITETAGFKSFGEQLVAIAHAATPGIHNEEWDRRLVNLYNPGVMGAASGANEKVPSEGGFLVQTDIGAPLVESVFEPGSLLSRVRRVPISANSNSLRLPALDETSRADGSRWGGILAYWAGEASTVTATKPKFRDMELTLHKLFGLGYATQELLEDASALNAIMSRAFTEEITFKAEDAVINGDGAGKPLGIMNSGAVVTVSKESGQAADTIVTANVLKMFSRLPPRSMTRAVWLVNQDCLPQLFSLTLGSGTAVVLLYRPPGVDGPNTNAPGGTLLGLPVIPVEYAASIGDLGDIQLVDLDQYLMIDKSGVRSESSIHVRFLYDETTFRFIYRLDGEPLWRSAITPFKGSATKSPYVILQAR